MYIASMTVTQFSALIKSEISEALKAEKARLSLIIADEEETKFTQLKK